QPTALAPGPRLPIYDLVHEDNAPWASDVPDAKVTRPSPSLASTCRPSSTEAIGVQDRARHGYWNPTGFRIDRDAVAHFPILYKIDRRHESFDAFACAGLTAVVTACASNRYPIMDLLTVPTMISPRHSTKWVGRSVTPCCFLEAVRVGVATVVDWEQTPELVDDPFLDCDDDDDELEVVESCGGRGHGGGVVVRGSSHV
ncbi:hypothetical protein Tdes44962_MAKER05451, partial [Teratosphaeria destructans]